VVRFLFSTPVHERYTLGIFLLASYQDRLDRRDLALVEQLVRRGAWWNFVDFLAVDVADPILRSDPRSIPILLRWAKDPEIWVRRAALLAPLPGLKSGEHAFSLFSRIATPMLTEREFFIRKAIGWVLRDVAKRHPDVVASYLEANLRSVSPLTFREAVKYLPKDRRELLEGQAALGGKGPARAKVPVRP
jgi:3-methyladenine DNA glycosylase AlkD